MNSGMNSSRKSVWWNGLIGILSKNGRFPPLWRVEFGISKNLSLNLERRNKFVIDLEFIIFMF